MNYLSLFSGAGGLDLGFEQQGFTPVLAYDIKSCAVQTYNMNRGSKQIAKVENLGKYKIAETIIRDISSLGDKNIPRGVIGGPPCQYFSNGNKAKRKSKDIKRLLPGKYANLLRVLNETYNIDYFIFENVDGLAKPKHIKDFEKILGLFEKAGFYTSWNILDAYNFGVPQLRKRVFIIGWNKKFYPENKFIFPIGTPSNLKLKDKIEGLCEPIYFKRNLDPNTFPVHPNHWTMRPISAKFTDPMPTDMRKSTRSFRRLLWNEPSATVAYGHNEIHIHPKGNRRLSLYEAMLLQGFPNQGYRLYGTLTEQVSLISDAVPPPLASALAAAIKDFIQNNRNEKQ